MLIPWLLLKAIPSYPQIFEHWGTTEATSLVMCTITQIVGWNSILRKKIKKMSFV